MENLKFNTWYYKHNADYELCYIYNIRSEKGYYGIVASTYTNSNIVNVINIFSNIKIENKEIETTGRYRTSTWVEAEKEPDITEEIRIKLIKDVFDPNNRYMK